MWVCGRAQGLMGACWLHVNAPVLPHHHHHTPPPQTHTQPHTQPHPPPAHLQPRINKILKALEERALVKHVKSVQNANRKASQGAGGGEKKKERRESTPEGGG